MNNVESEIRIARMRLKLSKIQLALLINTSEERISEYESGKKKVPEGIIDWLVMILNLQSDPILGKN